jgi:hypothetical protein
MSQVLQGVGGWGRRGKYVNPIAAILGWSSTNSHYRIVQWLDLVYIKK